MTSKEDEYRSVLKAFEGGDKSAKTKIKLAMFKLSGQGGAEIDEKGAFKLLAEAQNTDKEALWMLGLCYEFGLGTEQDCKRAEVIYKRAGIYSEVGKSLIRNGKTCTIIFMKEEVDIYVFGVMIYGIQKY